MRFSSSYFIKSSLLVITCIAVVLFLYNNSTIHLIPLLFLFPLALFYIFNNLIQSFLLKKNSGRPQAFVNGFLATLSIKMFLHLSVIFVFAFTLDTLAIEFVLLYASYYLLFTILDVIELSSVIQKNK